VSTADPAPPDWHAQSPEQVRARLGVGDDGLSAAQAAERLAVYGPNVLPRVSGPSWWSLLARRSRAC
jgi:Cation transporter/ATPase, N-terminus